MVRNYKKKEKPYKEEAVEEIKNGTRKLREAAIFYKIDKSLLSRRILGKNTGQRGRKTPLTLTQELFEHLKVMAKWGFALTKTDVLYVVADFVSENEIKVPFKNFLRQEQKVHRNILGSGRENTSVLACVPAAGQVLPPLVIFLSANLWTSWTGKKDIPAGQDLPPLVIFLSANLWTSWTGKKDIPGTYYANTESGFITASVFGDYVRKYKCIGMCSCSRTSSASIGYIFVSKPVDILDGVLACVPAAGQDLPPLVIFLSANLWTSWTGKKDIPGTYYANTESGFITASVFGDYVRKYKCIGMCSCSRTSSASIGYIFVSKPVDILDGVLACVPAAGQVLPPLVIFLSANLWTSWTGKKDIPGTYYANTESGFITASVFGDYVRKYKVYWHVFLQQDKFCLHWLYFCQQTCGHLGRPLDRCCFCPFKQSGAMLRSTSKRNITKSEFVDELCLLWYEGMIANNVISGFKSTRIFPSDHTKYPLDRINPEKLTRYKANEPDVEYAQFSEATQCPVVETDGVSVANVQPQEA
ncbi:hypothetical protein PR048_032017 [Dryococelus australis]|uniref:HTH psq-type domain-containing protein n=1 Tax=Dryococelus australis TaxID=614101 RepID=A0ABQ9G6Z1_9NEOP|nr:hypothetical protein PR048_032017 [Dryococelus australis]